MSGTKQGEIYCELFPLRVQVFKVGTLKWLLRKWAVFSVSAH